MRSPWRSTHPLVALGVSALAWAGPIAAQTRGAVEAERREFAAWLRDAPLSPRRAVVVRPVGPGLSLGPSDTDIPLEGVSRGRITERAGRVMLEWRADTTSLARGRSLALGDWHLVASGPPGRASVTAFGRASRTGKSVIWFRYDPAQVYNVVLTPPQAATTLRVLGADGVEVEATEAGTVVLQVSGSSQRLRVLRMPGSSDDESELEVYFRDPTNSGETYPSGRFVSLIPKPGGGYLIDLNRARSPFCAYNTVFPCPAPWKGNAFAVRVAAGERYRVEP